jgi:hypothetical protein
MFHVAPIHSPAQIAPAEAWLPPRRWPFHLSALLASAAVVVMTALAVVAWQQAGDVPFTCEDGARLRGGYNVGAHWCTREVDHRLVRDGRYVRWHTRGFPRVIGSYALGKPTGTWLHLDESGGLTHTSTY